MLKNLAGSWQVKWESSRDVAFACQGEMRCWIMGGFACSLNSVYTTRLTPTCRRWIDREVGSWRWSVEWFIMKVIKGCRDGEHKLMSAVRKETFLSADPVMALPPCLHSWWEDEGSDHDLPYIVGCPGLNLCATKALPGKALRSLPEGYGFSPSWAGQHRAHTTQWKSNLQSNYLVIERGWPKEKQSWFPSENCFHIHFSQ